MWCFGIIFPFAIFRKEDYEAAKEDLGTLLTIAPKYTRAYLMRGEVSLKQNDNDTSFA